MSSELRIFSEQPGVGSARSLDRDSALDIPQGQSRSVALSFDGSKREFAKWLVRGGALIVVTATIYRFWFITDLRRYLWSHTRLGDERFEYTGTGRELLKGFLLAVAVLVPVYVCYAVLGLVAASLQAFASIPLGGLFYGLTQYAAYRGRQYRASRTVLRGVRFWMTGSGWGYAGRAVLWDIGTLLTLGLLLPWRIAALERFAMRNTRFGDLAGDFTSTGATLFRRGWILWAVSVVVVVFVVMKPVGDASLLAILALPVIVPLFLGTRWRWRVEGVRFGRVSLSSTLEAGGLCGPVFKLYAALFGYGLLVGGIVGAIAFGTRSTIGSDPGSWTPTTLIAVIFAGLSYLAFLVGAGALKRYFIDRGVWQKVVESTSVHNLSALDAVVAKGSPASSLGEGLADALDVGF